jgi:hypothetical protein
MEINDTVIYRAHSLPCDLSAKWARFMGVTVYTLIRKSNDGYCIVQSNDGKTYQTLQSRLQVAL